MANKVKPCIPRVLTEDVDRPQTHNPYRAVKNILELAYEQAAYGKGHTRHGNDQNFEDQQLMRDLKDLGIGPAVYQIRKKALETTRLPHDHAKRETLGIIIYAVAMYLELERQENQMEE